MTVNKELTFYSANPTLMEMMGVKQPLPQGLEGKSYAPILTGKKNDIKRPTSQLYLYIEERAGDPMYGRRGVRTHRYTMYVQKLKGQPISWVLYDNQNDPFQVKNIAQTSPDTVRQLIKNELTPWLKRTNDPFILPEFPG